MSSEHRQSNFIHNDFPYKEFYVSTNWQITQVADE